MSEVTSTNRGGARAWLIWSLSALAFGYAFFQRVTPSVMVADLMREFAVGGAVLGYLSALYFYPYVILQIPLGALLDRLGARLLLTIALSIAALGSVLFGTAETLSAAYLGRVLIGVGSAVGFIGSLALAAKWFPPHRFAFLAGLAMFFAMMSGMLAQAPLALFVERYGWRAGMIDAGIFAAILAAVIFLVVRNSPALSGDQPSTPVTSWGDVWTGFKIAASTREIWKIAIVATAMTGPMLTIGGLWGTPYLISAYELTRPEAAFYVSLMLFGWAVGAPFCGWFSDRVRRRKLLLVGPSAVLCACLAIIVFVPGLPLWLTVALFTTTGFTGGGMAVTFALAREVSLPSNSGSAAGIVNAMTVASGAILQPLVGVILDWVWNGTMFNGSRIYASQDYRFAFILILTWAFAGFLMTLLLRETHAKNITVST